MTDMQENAPTKEYEPWQFRPGNPDGRAGRPKGSQNRYTKLLKEAVIEAAELEGFDGKGKDGVVGLLRKICKKDLKTFAMLMARAMPLQIEGRNDVRVEVLYDSIEDVRQELAERGISMELVKQLLYEPPEAMIIENDDPLK